MERNKYRYWIGIDCGVNTGVSIWDSVEKRFIRVSTVRIHEAMQLILNLTKDEVINQATFIRVEDARKRNWFGSSGKERAQGAGSIKRDSKIWEDFLTDMKANFEMVAPKNNKTKLTGESFKKITKWEGKTNEHSRDSGMLVFGM